MNNSTNQTDVFGNSFAGLHPDVSRNQPYTNQMQTPQQVAPNQTYQMPGYQNSNMLQPTYISNAPFQGQMGMNENQGVQSFTYSNQSYPQAGLGMVYPQKTNSVGQIYTQSIPNQPSFVANNVQENYVPPVNDNPPFVVQKEPVLEKQEEVVKPTDSYTEMAFAGVNKQEEPNQVTVLTSEAKPVEHASPVEVSVAENMQPVEKKADENAGLKFLGVIFFILIVVILCLPLIGLN